MRLQFVTAAAAVALATGCANQSPERQALMSEAQRTVPVCEGERDCAAKWEAAQLWVVRNAGFKIQTVTSVLIQTFNASNHSIYLAATITKEPQGGGRYRILSSFSCANMFGCSPDPAKAIVEFNRFVSAATP